jgi:hypothetical protein
MPLMTMIDPQPLNGSIFRRERRREPGECMGYPQLDHYGMSWLGTRGAARRSRAWAACAFVLALLDVGTVQAGGHHRHGHWHGTSVGVVVGAPLGWPYYRGGFYGWPYYDAPRTIVVERAPPVYIERGSAGGDTGEGWWHYCRDPEGYYPAVKKCPGGWERVAPTPSE